jgi:8-amino-7-oxononanoate synthase
MEPVSPTADQIQDWIVRRLAQVLSVEPEEIDVHEPILDYGLESVEAITLSGELADWLQRKLSPTLWWECPTIARLSERLSAQASLEPQA